MVQPNQIEAGWVHLLHHFSCAKYLVEGGELQWSHGVHIKLENSFDVLIKYFS